jgi:acyl carrier protein
MLDIDIELRVRTLVAKLAKVPTDRVTSKSDVRKLGIDSLIALELVASLERAFHVHIPEGKIRDIVRVDQIVNTIAGLKKSSGHVGLSHRTGPHRKRQRAVKV